ncbi:MAG: HAD-IC family P-type ATPase [Litorivicinus sp.]
MTKPTWHDRSVESVLTELDATTRGLTQREAQGRQAQFGQNQLPQPKAASPLARFMRQFHNVLIYVLIASSLVTAVLGHWIDSGVILAVVLANAAIGFIQEGKAEAAMHGLRDLLAPTASVIRDGRRSRLPSIDLVPGDLVVLEAGDKVPADLRLVSANTLSAQEAMLTGESLPTDKNTSPSPTDASLGDRTGMLYSGTLITRGQGSGVVVAIGTNTEVGRISGLLADVNTLTTPLLTQMSLFSTRLTLMILLIGGVLMLYGYTIAEQDFKSLLMAVVGLSVAAIPEGLPAVLTITLAVGVQAMARRNAIIRRLPIIETLGAVSVICTDKTGTLTRNEMTVASTLAATETIELARAAMLCNDAALGTRDGQRVIEGDPMEGALLVFAHPLNPRPAPRLAAIPFDAEHRFMATLHQEEDGSRTLYVKGSPEAVLTMCNDTGQTQPIDHNAWSQRAEAVAAQGQRVLAFAVKQMPPNQSTVAHSDVRGGMTLLGMVGLIDPPREEAIAAVADCHRAGIRVKMITGDHPKTAAAIGEKIGLSHTQVLTGAELDRFNDEDLTAALQGCDVFARTNPEHKLRLVKALQSQGLTVAMTGDGVNDAPALKRADAGIAMGLKGCAAAKEAADVVLADDNFASIVAAVREGRTVYRNIGKVIGWTLPTSIGEAMTVIVALLFSLTMPITPLQILWINLITAATLGMALAFEPSEPDIMRHPPRTRDEPLLTRQLGWHIVFVSLLFLAGVYGVYTASLQRGDSIELARTLAVNTLVAMEIFQLFYIRGPAHSQLSWSRLRATPTIWLVVGITVTAQLLLTYAPPLQRLFETANLNAADWLIVLGVSGASFALAELTKHLRLALSAETAR